MTHNDGCTCRTCRAWDAQTSPAASERSRRDVKRSCEAGGGSVTGCGRRIKSGYCGTDGVCSACWSERQFEERVAALVAERDHYRAALELLHSPTRRQDLDQGRGLTHYIGDVLLHGK